MVAYFCLKVKLPILEVPKPLVHKGFQPSAFLPSAAPAVRPPFAYMVSISKISSSDYRHCPEPRSPLDSERTYSQKFFSNSLIKSRPYTSHCPNHQPFSITLPRPHTTPTLKSNTPRPILLDLERPHPPDFLAPTSIPTSLTHTPSPHMQALILDPTPLTLNPTPFFMALDGGHI